MASSLCPFVFLLFIAHHFSTSFSAPIFLPLTHSLSTSRFNTTRHLLKAASARSAARFLHHRLGRHLSHRSSGRRQVFLPLYPGSDYTLDFTLDSHPPQSVSLYMDTGSDLVWFPCFPFHCIRCGGLNPNVVTLNRSSTSAVSCLSDACKAAHQYSLSSPDLCAAARCPLKRIETSDCASFSCPPFYYAYGKGSLIARLYTHSVSIPTFSPALVLRNFTFGCAHSALESPIGIAGFGRRSPLSLPTQLASLSPQLGNRFSYCLVSQSFEPKPDCPPSPLILGRKEVMSHEEAEFVYTEMLDNPTNPSGYFVGLQGISVGRKHIPSAENLRAVDGRGNVVMLVDSGSTLTTLPAGLYRSVVAEFERRLGLVRKRANEVEDETMRSPCYYLDNATIASLPTVTLHFVGQESSVVLPSRNYFYILPDDGDGGSSGRRSRKGCFMMDGGDEAEMDGGPMAILGNYQQQGFEVVYDLEKQRVGFARRNCSSLWDSLNRH